MTIKEIRKLLEDAFLHPEALFRTGRHDELARLLLYFKIDELENSFYSQLKADCNG